MGKSRDKVREGERLRALAARQQGRVTWAQLRHLGMGDSDIHRAVRAGRLIALFPRVYAVGHTAPNRTADLWAAVLYAGPGAMLSHGTAAHHRGLLDRAPREIEVSTPRKVSGQRGLKVHGRRQLTRATFGGLPVTTVAQTVRDLAAGGELRLVRRALAQLDYRHILDIEALLRTCGPGRPGSTTLREALATHQPQLAHTNGPLEEEFLEWCERHEVPVPEFNVWVHDVLVDAHWPAHGLVVELDGRDNHSSPAQIRRDRSNDLKLRRRGLTVLRYDWSLLGDRPQEVRADITAVISRNEPRAPARRSGPRPRPR